MIGEPLTMPEETPPPGHNGNGLELGDLAEILNVRVRELGPEHPDTLQSRHTMAVGFFNLGRVQDAVWLNEETLRIRERVLGAEHPDTLHSRNDLASGYYHLGRVVEAVWHYEDFFFVSLRVFRGNSILRVSVSPWLNSL